MIKRLYETHINVLDLDRAMAFYSRLPDFEVGHVDWERRIAFYFIGGWGCSMLGVWEKPAAEVLPMHLAFEVALEDLPGSIAHLKALGIQPLDFQQAPGDAPVVFSWMPAAGIYFKDPDGHLLEFIAMLPGAPQPARGLTTLEDWGDGG
jgi:catechol 2,3-dioxygenase-like lactoylglutathione lyase family enzyme